MASLTGQLVSETYRALLKVIDNDILTASEKQITDGLGGGSNVFIDSQGFLRANKYKVTNGLATQFLKADGSLDTNTYLTSITGAQVITALGYTPVPTTRTITINGETHDLSANNSWTIAGTAAVWGNITGTLSNQTDLQAALNAKFNVPAGTISQYIRGDGSIANFPTIAGGLPTGGTAGQILSKIDSTDYNAHWIDNYATQTKNEVKLGATLAKGAAVYVSSANGTNMIVSAASNTSEATSSKTFGLLETGGVTNDQVKCVTFGLIAGLDTSAASAGDPVWLGVNGALIFGLANKPVAPAHMVYIGVVTRVQSNNGEIFVNVQNGFEIEELHDVLIQSKVNNQGLFYESSTGLWKNKSIATVLGYTPQAQLDGIGFVKASGTTISYDNSTYLTTADAAATYLALTGGTLSGNLTISSANPKLLLTDTDNNPDYSIQNYNGTFKISDETNSADRFFIYSTGIGYYNGDFKANKLYVEGGLSTQFIKGDGTLDTNTYLTSASLDGYLAKAGGTMTGDLNFYTLKTTRVGGNAYIRGNWQGSYWGLGAAATGHTIIIDQVDFSTGAYESITDVNLMLGTRTVVHSGNVATYALPITGGTVTGSITATSFVKSGGTASEFLMADGSVSTLSSPVTGSGSAGYIPKWTTAANIGSSLIYDDGTSIGIAYSTPNKGGYGRTLTGAAFGSASFGFEAVGGTTTNGGLVGGLSFILSQNDSSRLVGSAIQSNLVGTTATNYGADLRFFAKADAGVIGEVARMTSAGLRVYGTIIKDGGTAAQFLKADGSIDSNTYLTSSSAIDWSNIAGKPTTLSGYGIDNAVEAIYGSNINPNTQLGNYTAMTTQSGISGWTHVLSMAWQPNTVANWVSQLAFAVETGTGAYYRTTSGAISSASWIRILDASNFSTYAVPNRIQSNWNDSTVISNVVGLLSWKNYGNSHVIFDASAGTSPSGTSVNKTNSTAVWESTYPTLMGWNGSQTYGVRVDTSRYSDTSGNAYLLNGYAQNQTGGANTIVQRDGNGYIQNSYFYSSGGGAERNGSGLSYIAGFNSGDYYIRSYNSSAVATMLGLGSAAYQNTTAFAGINGDATRLFNVFELSFASTNFNPSAAPRTQIDSMSLKMFQNYFNGTGLGSDYGTVMEYYSLSGHVDSQVYFDASGGSWYRTASYNAAYGGWQRYITDANYTNWLVPKTGGMYTGTLTVQNGYSFVADGINNNGGFAMNNASTYWGLMWNMAANDWRLGRGSQIAQNGWNLRWDASDNVFINKNLYLNNEYGSSLVGVYSSYRFQGVYAMGDAYKLAMDGSSPGSLYGLSWSHPNAGGQASFLTNHGLLVMINGSTYTAISDSIWTSGAVSGGQRQSFGFTIGYISSSWAGNSTYPTLYGSTPDRWVMHINPHISYVQNGYGGFTGSMTGATIRMASDLSATHYWDLGIGVCGIGADKFGIGRNGTSLFTISNGGNVTGTAFFESSDIRLKTLIENNPIIDGIEKLEAKLYEKNGKIELGYFAQDAELIMPYAVTKNTDGFLNLSYREVHTAKIARLEQRVAELEKQLNVA